MYPNGTTKIYSTTANINNCKIPDGITLVKIIEEVKIKPANISVNINSFDPYSSVFSQDAPMDSKTLLSSYIIWATISENLANKYIPGSINNKNPKAAAIVTIK